MIFDNEGNARILPTLGMVVLIATISAIRTTFGFLVYTSSGVLAIVVPVAGTVVALALPAAQLAQTVTTDILSNAQDLIRANFGSENEVRDFLKLQANNRRKDLEAMKCAIYYGLASLISGLAGVFGAFSQSKLFFVDLSASDFLACFSTTCLVTSVLWFLPVIHSSFSLKEVDEIIDLIREPETSASPPASTDTAPAASPKDAG